jgi:hypothetical protein
MSCGRLPLHRNIFRKSSFVLYLNQNEISTAKCNCNSDKILHFSYCVYIFTINTPVEGLLPSTTGNAVSMSNSFILTGGCLYCHSLVASTSLVERVCTK